MSYGDVVTDEMSQAHTKVVGLALSRAQSNSRILERIFESLTY
jgi:hypothetical protein